MAERPSRQVFQTSSRLTSRTMRGMIPGLGTRTRCWRSLDSRLKGQASSSVARELAGRTSRGEHCCSAEWGHYNSSASEHHGSVISDKDLKDTIRPYVLLTACRVLRSSQDSLAPFPEREGKAAPTLPSAISGERESESLPPPMLRDFLRPIPPPASPAALRRTDDLRRGPPEAAPPSGSGV